MNPMFGDVQDSQIMRARCLRSQYSRMRPRQQNRKGGETNLAARLCFLAAVSIYAAAWLRLIKCLSM
jgi:hypothetical protein